MRLCALLNQLDLFKFGCQRVQLQPCPSDGPYPRIKTDCQETIPASA